MDKRPIGIFDSGLGGLSAVRAMLKYLPNEDIVYFGDTERVPYGTRSKKTIEKFAREDIALLEGFDCKLIMAACGTVSAVATEATANIKEPFVGVVKPASRAAVSATKNGKIGVMATSATINSNAHVKEIKALNPNASVFGVACPLLVSLVENSWIDGDDFLVSEIIGRYTKELTENGVDTIILGCTHFPHLAPIIQNVVGDGITLIDNGYEAVMEVKNILVKNTAQNAENHRGKVKYFVSDEAQNFSEIAKTLLGRDISGEVQYKSAVADE